MTRKVPTPHFIQSVSQFLLKPRQLNEDAQRREFILNILLLGSIALSLVALISASANAITQGTSYQGTPPTILAIPVLFFFLLYVLSRLRQQTLASSLLVLFYYAAGTYTLTRWGILIPQGILIYALILIMAGILIHTRFALAVTLLICGSLFWIEYARRQSQITVKLWSSSTAGMDDAIVFSITFFVILAVSWLGNREIEKSLQRARRSEAALKRERDNLEIRVEERTKELQQSQLERTMQLYRFAEFGKLASALIHDLANPLSTLSLNLEQLKNQEQHQALKRALEATNRMEQYISTTRKQLQDQSDTSTFGVKAELQQVLEILQHRARTAGVTATIDIPAALKIQGSVVRFHQLMANLITNAIDTYDASPLSHEQRTVHIDIEPKINALTIRVTDHGKGIPADKSQEIFEPFFTTKSPERGMGLGLSICKDIVEKDFGGTIQFVSTPAQGTVFLVTIPQGGLSDANAKQIAHNTTRARVSQTITK